MRGIGEFLLFDERIVVQPVEQLRAVGADDLGLRIMDVGVDETGHDETSRNDRRRVAPRGARARMSRASPTASISPPATRTAPSSMRE